MKASMHEQPLGSIDDTPPETAAEAPAPNPVETNWRADIGDRLCCTVFASASLVTIAWLLWTAYRLSALR